MPRLMPLLAVAATLSACVQPQAWWQADLQEWEGAPVSELLDAWGPPLRTMSGDGGKSLLVFESARETDDRRVEALRDPGAQLGPESRWQDPGRSQRSECTLTFEISGDTVMGTRHDGAACYIVPRDPARRRTDVEPLRRR